MDGFERLLRDLAKDNALFEEWKDDPVAVGARPKYGLSPAEVALILSGDKEDIDAELAARGSSALYQPRGQVVV